MRAIFFVSLMMLVLCTNAQEENGMVRDGNRAFKQEKYPDAELDYRKALQVNPTMPQANYNLGVAMQAQERIDEALKQYEKAAPLIKDSLLRAKLYHNMGNAYISQKKWDEAISAYKNALKLQPKDMDTKYNLMYALSKKQQQEQQNQDQQQQQQNQDQDKKDQDKNQQEQQQQNQQENDKQDQNQQNQDKKEEQNQQQQKQGGGTKKEMSKEEAEQMLEAIKNREKNVQEKMKKKPEDAVEISIDKDW